MARAYQRRGLPGRAGPRTLGGVIAVVGVGAIGGVCAAQLLEVRDDVVCGVRRGFEDLVLKTPAGELRHRPRVVRDPGAIAEADWLLLATKAHQTEGAAPWLEAAASARVAVLQNGVEHVTRLSTWVVPERIVPVVVACPSIASSPGQIVQQAGVTFSVPDDANGADFAALFEGTPVEIPRERDWTSVAWRKLCFNVTSGALASLAARPMPEVRHPRKAELARALARECASVARAEGADVDEVFAEDVALRAATATKGGTPSTLADRLAGRPLEVDARNGAVVRFAKRHRLPAPVNTRACELMRDAHLDPETDLLPALVAAL